MNNYKELRDALAAGPTEGPWTWRINRRYKDIDLVGRHCDVVMDFARWGMGGASPRFACKMRSLKILYRPADRPDWIADHSYYTTAHRNVVQEDARYIAAADPTTVRKLLADLDAARSDAARYRWLTSLDCADPRFTGIANDLPGRFWDESIDDAIGEAK